MAAVYRISDADDRADALSVLAQDLAQMGNREGVLRALAVVHGTRRTYAYAKALAAVASPGDVKMAKWIVEAFHRARERGREEVWAHIDAFAPVLAKLGVISETWERIQRVEAVVRSEESA